MESNISFKELTKNWGIFLSFSDVFEEEFSISIVEETIKKFRSIDLLAFLSKLNIALNTWYYGDWNNNEIVYNLFHDRAKDILKKISQIKTNAIIHDLQVLNLIKLTILFGENKEENYADIDKAENRMEIGKALLMLSDILNKENTKRISNSNLTHKDKFNEILKYIVMSYAFNSNVKINEALARNYKYIFEIYPKIKHEFSINLFEEFKKSINIDYNLYFQLSLLIFSRYYGIEKERLANQDVTIDINAFIKNTTIEKEHVVSFFNELSLDAYNYADLIKNEFKSEAIFSYQMISFKKYPFIKFDNRYICISVQHLIDKITTNGLFWTVANKLDEQKRSIMFTIYGRIFEKYVNDLLDRIFPESSVLCKRLYRLDNIKIKKKTKISDYLILSPNSICIMEVKSKRLKKNIVERGNLADFEEYLGDVLLKSINQMKDTLALLQKGYIIEGMKNIPEKYIFVIIVNEKLPQEYFSHTYYQKYLSELHISKEDMNKLVILSIEELEVIETMTSDISFESLLLDKLNDSQRLPKSFKNFVQNKYPQSWKKRNENLYSTLMNVILNETSKLLKE